MGTVKISCKCGTEVERARGIKNATCSTCTEERKRTQARNWYRNNAHKSRAQKLEPVEVWFEKSQKAIHEEETI